MEPNTFYIKAKTIVGHGQNFEHHCLLVDNGKIAAIVPQTNTLSPCFDFGETTIVPGLIDLHIHGREGCDVMDGKVSSLETISKSLASHGVTGFLATTVTSSWDETLNAMDTLGRATKLPMPGAKVLGGYSEGLFFTADHKGAHNDDYFLELTKERIDALFEASHGQLKVIALAPEIDNACEMVTYIKELGIRPMLGHTNATYEQTVNALNAGATGGVHVFNGMRGIHHREPGCTGAVLTEDTNIEVIADGVHLHPAILKMICKLKDPKQITLISDCINAGGLSDGRYKLGKMEVEVTGGIARTETGSLAGSTLTLERAVQNLSKLAGINFRDSVHMASLSPAGFLNIADYTGSLSIGKNADFAVLNKTGGVEATFIEGKLMFTSGNYTALTALKN